MSASHRIRRLRWNARASSAADAFALRGLLRERGDAAQAALDRALGEVEVGDAVVHLGRLELRLDAIDLAALADDFELAIERAARDSVRLALLDVHHAPTPVAGEARRHPPAVARRESLRHYLRTGVLDWTLAGIAPEEATQALRLAADETATAVDALDELLAGIEAPAPRVGALLRWLRLLPPARRRAWVRAHAPAAPAGPIADALQALRVAIGNESREVEPLQALWLAWRRDAAPAARAAWQRGVVDWLKAVEPPTVAAQAFASALRAETAEASATPVVATRPAAPASREPEGADTTLLVPLAGLVLMHPYLPRLLAACGLVEPHARAFPPAALPRACALLHWLATGRDEAPEFDLPLIKLLLGNAPDAPLDHAPPTVSDTDRAEAIELLSTVPTHWTALRGTGSDGLRLSFLQRRGLLARGDSGWLLRMQAESFDLLLSTLPWSIGLIRLPWMAQALRVEWEAP